MVLAGPSGAGKTTLARHLVEARRSTRFSVSTTTRRPREGEMEGRDYFFVTPCEFDRRVEAGYFLEWARVHGERYGTSGEWVASALESGCSVVLDIDVQGALAVRKRVPGAVLIFVLPPGMRALESRLAGRGTDSPEDVRNRLTASAEEIRWAGAFDYLLVNDGLPEARRLLESVFDAELARTDSALGSLVSSDYEALFPGCSGLWEGRRVVVASGPTREAIDDVRFVSNRSSGLMGCELAAAFRDLGARVTLLLGPCATPPPRGVVVRGFTSASDLGTALEETTREGCDLLAMAAAVADFRPAARVPGKIHRSCGPFDIRMEPVPDLLAGLDCRCPRLAFALEYGDAALENARGKMEAKNCEAVFCNRGDVPGTGMESEGNAGVLLLRSGGQVEIPRGSKRFVALRIAFEMGRRLVRASV